MPELRNKRHEAFCQGVAKGFNYTEAYMRAGYTTTDRAAAGRGAYKLRRDQPAVLARIEELTGKRRGKIARDQVVEAMRVGRPTEYRDELNELARKYALLGLTEEEMADLLNISRDRLIEWRAKYPKFDDAIKRGAVNADARVAEKLYHRALGARVPAQKAFQYEGQILTHDYVEHYPPDTSAAMRWLTNRQPDRWRYRQEVEHRTPLDRLREKVAAMTPEERRAWMMDVAERAMLTIGREPQIEGPAPAERDDEIPE